MDALAYLEGEKGRTLGELRRMADDADSRGDGMTAEEREKSARLMDEVKDLTVKIEAEREKKKFREKIDGFDNMVNGQDPNPVREPATHVARGKSIGQALTESDGFKLWAAKAQGQPKAPRFTTPAVEVPWPSRAKAAGDPVLESDNAAVFAGGPGPLTTFLGLETPGFVQFRLTIADLIPSVPVGLGNSVTYPVVKTRTQISGTPQTEGEAKPGGEYEFDMVTETLVTLAGWVKLSTQFLEDAPALAAYVNADLPLQIRQNEEAYLASALYTDSAGVGGGGTVDGTGIGGTNGFDAILEAVTTIQENGGDPNAMIITPSDWAALLVTKNTGGDENYTGGGPFSPTNNPWQLRVVITPSATTGLPLVGDYARGAKVYRKGGLSVESTNTDQDDFIKNKITVRAEERIVEGTTYPEFFVQADIGTS